MLTPSPERDVGPERAALAALILLFVCSAVLVSTIVPPWQDPDSPTHFALVRKLALADPSPEAAEALEGEVIASMARYRWWEPYELETPEPLPVNFLDMEFGAGTYDQPLYYVLADSVLTVTAPRTLEAAYWHLRGLSIAICALALVMGWAGTRLMFGPATALGATSVAVLFPQLLVTGIAVNPNVLAALWGGLAWWQIGRVVRHRTPGISLALVVVAAVASLFTKRSAIPFAVASLVIAVWLFVHVARGWGAQRRAVVAIAAIAAPILLGTVMVLETEGLLAYWRRTINLVRELESPVGPFEYAMASVDHTWFVAGWHRFLAPEPWRAVARGITVVAAAGAIASLVGRTTVRPFVAMAWVLVTAQIIVVLTSGYWGFNVPHGRYAETVLAPMAVLLWVGFSRALPRVGRPFAGPALIAVLAFLNVTAVTTVLIPAYFPW